MVCRGCKRAGHEGVVGQQAKAEANQSAQTLMHKQRGHGHRSNPRRPEGANDVALEIQLARQQFRQSWVGTADTGDRQASPMALGLSGAELLHRLTQFPHQDTQIELGDLHVALIRQGDRLSRETFFDGSLGFGSIE